MGDHHNLGNLSNCGLNFESHCQDHPSNTLSLKTQSLKRDLHMVTGWKKWEILR